MITPGTVLIQRETLRPEFFDVADGPYPSAFMALTHRLAREELETELSRTGWTFAHMTGSINSIGFGFNREKMINAALKRIIARVQEQRCNCVEIDQIETHSFLGVPYVNVSAHARRIQKQLVFSEK